MPSFGIIMAPASFRVTYFAGHIYVFCGGVFKIYLSMYIYIYEEPES